MNFKSVDDVLNHLNQNEWISVNKLMNSKYLDEADRLGLIYKNDNTFRLDKLGYEVLASGLTYNQYNEKMKTSNVTNHFSGNLNGVIIGDNATMHNTFSFSQLDSESLKALETLKGMISESESELAKSYYTNFENELKVEKPNISTLKKYWGLLIAIPEVYNEFVQGFENVKKYLPWIWE